MTGRKNRALQVPYVGPYKALGNFPKALYGTKRALRKSVCSLVFLLAVETHRTITRRNRVRSA